ncbi:RING finger protein 215-like [Diadema antillarum]|uniref:RING finger protein 215-like n=1 Tax=Diadema antillarum TaxID=105358 RepID=UPI003A860072
MRRTSWRKARRNSKMLLPPLSTGSSTSLRSVANACTSCKLSSWALVLSLLLQLVSGEREAVIRVQPGGAAIQGSYAGSGPDRLNVTGVLRTITNSCDQEGDVVSYHSDDGDNQEEKSEEEEDWIGIFHLPPLEEPAGAQGGTGCSLLEQVKQAMLFGASALLVLALNPGLFKEIELNLTTDTPIILISDPREVKKFQRSVDLRKGRQKVKITSKPESTAKTKTISAPKLTLWSTCGRSSGGSKFKEWEGTVCLDPLHASAEHGFGWIWRSLVSLAVGFYIINVFLGRIQVQHLGQNNHEDLEGSLRRLAEQAMSRMPVWKYKRKRYQQSSESPDSCAVCLDEFHKGQTIRMLPCHHQFHNKCVESWLRNKRTCPLCKLDIVDQRFGWGEKC